MLNFIGFRDYPVFKAGSTLADPYVEVNWPQLRPWLDDVEPRLALAERRVRVSRYFRDKDPPEEYLYLKSQIYNFLLCIGNFYGFTRLPQPSVENRPVDLERSIHYLMKAAGWYPEEGFTYFCIAAVKGILGIELYETGKQKNNTVLVAEAESLMRSALIDFGTAESRKHELPLQYHLKGYLLCLLGYYKESAEAWKIAAERVGTSPKMHFNRACVLALLKDYAGALTSLEKAVSLAASDNLPASQKFDVNANVSSDDGREFDCFRQESPKYDQATSLAVSTSGRTFKDIMS